MKTQVIDINQRIPLDTLETALKSYLDNNYSSDYVLEQLRIDFSGENRLKKSIRIVNKIIPNNPLNIYVSENKEVIKLALASKHTADRDIILISLLNSAFTFSFFTLQTLGKLFISQKIISRESLKKYLFNVYGGNRSTENALDSVVPMYLEANLFERPKPGIYEWKEPLRPVTPIARDLYQESFKINNAINDLQNYQIMDPYFHFLDR